MLFELMEGCSVSDDSSLPFNATIEEALSLLDLVLLTPIELTPSQQRAVHKLADFCREGLRGAPASEALEHRLTAAELRAARLAPADEAPHISKQDETP
jgi:hypothetical protein